MNRIEYSKTALNLIRSTKIEFHQKKVVFDIEVEKLKTKKSLREADKDEFQVKLAEFMKHNQIRTFAYDVCLSIEIYVHQKNSPSIHQIPKAYIDLIEKVVSKKVQGRKFLLIKNDKNVRVLNVNYVRSPNKKNRIVFSLYPFSVVRRAVNVLYRLKYGLYNLLDESYGTLQDNREDQIETEEYETIDEFWRMYSKESRGELETHDLIWYMVCKRRLQEDYFRKISGYRYFPIEIFFKRISIYAYSDLKREIEKMESFPVDPRMASVMNTLKKIDTVSYNFQIKLPENPQKEGESTLIKEKMSAEIMKIINRHPYLTPMFIPLSVLIIFSPGKSDIDVDNLARKFVIPIIEEHLQPPASYYSRIEDDDLRYEFTQAGSVIGIMSECPENQFFKKVSIRNYECIKLHRLPAESNGFINVCLYSERVNSGFLERLQRRICDYEVN